MNEPPSETPQDGGPGAPGFALRLDDLQARLARLQAADTDLEEPGADPASWQELFDSLDTAYGWLRLADEELRARRAELDTELRRLSDDMQRALSSRAVIEQAKGIVMAQRRCGPDEAFAHLTELSSQQERKLREVAQDLVDDAAADP